MSEVILFDVDGVLVRNFNDKKEFLWSLTIERDLGVTGAVMRDIFSGRWQDCLRGRADTKDHVRAVLAQHNMSLAAEDFIDYWHANDSHFEPAAMACVESLKGRRVFMATNQDKLRADYLKKTIGHLFEGIFAAADIGAMKPEEPFYEHIERALGIDPQNIIFFDDAASHVEAARRRGWDAYVYRGPDDLKRLAA